MDHGGRPFLPPRSPQRPLRGKGYRVRHPPHGQNCLATQLRGQRRPGVEPLQRISGLQSRPGAEPTGSAATTLRPNPVGREPIHSHRRRNRANPDSPAYGAQLPYVPKQTWKLWGRVGWNGLSLSATSRLVGTRFYSADESNALSPYQALDLRVAYEWSLGTGELALVAQVKNVLDRRYEIVRLYPMPPRHATFQLRFFFPNSS